MQLKRATAHYGDEHAFPAIVALGSVMSALINYALWLADVTRPVIDESDPLAVKDVDDPFNQAMYGYHGTGSIDIISDM